MDYCPDDSLSCLDCKYLKEWQEYGCVFHDCMNLDAPMSKHGEVDLSLAVHCRYFDPRDELFAEVAND